ncbi:RNA polymerase sigma factor [Piscinibacter sp. HJYY11]|uniref:RNA polymerase sigma factor n=1 Tax=Piscinibacter sp. HJYY11 TaxID=2801333 RepID=UPI00191F4BD4|nr:sigma-70 family RNA polymerase sigma factor [Piscinibacter sp. HJYY11]MBL0726593.1 sigma-70 family RNA polymerase sigma factor [Piscinibacter sp. HJYY11]
MTTQLAEHFFRHEYARLVALLSRRVGLQHLDAVEDAVQGALVAGLEAWKRVGPPDNPTAWLYRVAYNQVIGELRQEARRRRLADQHGASWAELAEEAPDIQLLADVHDVELRMLFVCCDPGIPAESQLVFALKTLCGSNVHEIAQRLFATEASVYKRLSRARSHLATLRPSLDDLEASTITSRLPAVQSILYTMFTEGHLSSHASRPLRRELCDEAKRLALLLALHPLAGTPETFALLALMHLHTARMAARECGAHELLLLNEQDRSSWDRAEMALGMSWLAASAQGPAFSRYHAEAGIAAEHCLSPSLAETRWDRIVDCYELLERVAPSTLHALGKALAVAEWRGPEQGLVALEQFDPPGAMADSYVCHAVLADLHRRCGRLEACERHSKWAIAGAPSPAIKAALVRRLTIERQH